VCVTHTHTHAHTRLDGSMSRDLRAENMRLFHRDASVTVLLATLKSGGMGLNLVLCVCLCASLWVFVCVCVCVCHTHIHAHTHIYKHTHIGGGKQCAAYRPLVECRC